jgi:DNA-binding NarL/FixJ family response regulator
MSIRVLVAEDQAIIRAGLIELLEKAPEVEVVGDVGDGHKAVELSGELSPDVVIMDLMMPRLDGIEATRRILAKNHGIGVLILSMYSDEGLVSQALRAGARGYLLKSSAVEELVRAVRAVASGDSFLCPQVSNIVIRDYIKFCESKDESLHQMRSLSAREREVLQLLTEGMDTKTIAKSLGISIKTVETHRTQIMKKLGIHSVAGLTKYAIRSGITSLDL